jgi:hypothetical protein
MTAAPGGRRHFDVIPSQSAVLVRARSNVGPIEFGMVGLAGYVEATVDDGTVLLDGTPAAHLELQVGELRSGNQLYDAELLRRIHARRFPAAVIDLSTALPGSALHYQLIGELTFHGLQRTVEGTVKATIDDRGILTVDGDHVFDIRDFDIAVPSMVMLKIFPDVRVELHVEAG